MTVSSTTAQQTFNCDGSTTIYTCPFRILDSGEIRGFLITVADNTSTELTNGVDFTVSGVGDANAVVTTMAAYTSAYQLKVRRATDRLQLVDYRDNDPFPAESHETALDRLTHIAQEVDDDVGRALLFPDPETGHDLPAAVDRAGKILAFDEDGAPYVSAPVSGSAADFALTLASSGAGNGDALIAVKSTKTGGVATTQHEVNERVINVFSFMTSAQIADVLAGTLTLDVSAAVQAAVVAAESNGIGLARKLICPGGRYRLDDDVVFTKQYITIEGEGQFETQFSITGATNGFTVSGLTYWRPSFRGFSIIGGASSLRALDMSGAGTVYNAEFSHLYLVSGGVAFYGGASTTLFSSEITGVTGGSYSGHWMHTKNGPCTNFRGCYGFFAGANKALYRMAGNVRLDGCNGGNDPGYDWWGIFGNDTASADGYQSDFSTADYADVNLIGCNVEYFASRAAGVGGGIRLQAQTRGFQFLGGKLERAALSTGYEAVIYARAGMNGGGAPFLLEPAWFQPGPGTPSLAELYCETAEGHFIDANGQIEVGGVTTCKRGANTYPTLKRGMTDDIYLGAAIEESAISPRRLSIQMVRYKTVTRTPVGAGQAIDVTGYSKVIVTPAAAASITTATFTATAGADLDAERNGELVIEAGNANLTINHTARGGAADTFVMTAGANLTLAAGQIVKFLRSETGSQWQQV